MTGLLDNCCHNELQFVFKFYLLARRFVVSKALAILGSFATISNHYCVTKVEIPFIEKSVLFSLSENCLLYLTCYFCRTGINRCIVSYIK
jgi:hypothetical protein